MGALWPAFHESIAACLRSAVWCIGKEVLRLLAALYSLRSMPKICTGSCKFLQSRRQCLGGVEYYTCLDEAALHAINHRCGLAKSSTSAEITQIRHAIVDKGVHWAADRDSGRRLGGRVDSEGHGEHSSVGLWGAVAGTGLGVLVHVLTSKPEAGPNKMLKELS